MICSLTTSSAWRTARRPSSPSASCRANQAPCSATLNSLILGSVKHQPTKYTFDVELVKRYSKPEYQGRQLRRVVEMTEKSAKMPVKARSPLPQVQRVDHRLPAETIAELVEAYRDGVGTPQLRRRYNLSQGSVIKILHGHGVEMRNQGLGGGDVATAAEMYRGGATLAQLGDRFGIPQCRAASIGGNRRGDARTGWE